MYRTLYYCELEINREDSKRVTQVIGRKLREIVEEVVREEPGVCARGNIMYMHAVADVQKHAEIITEKHFEKD